jgi:hypothetical protein
VNILFNVMQLEQAVTFLTCWGGRFETQLVHLLLQSMSWYSSNHFSKIMGCECNLLKPTGYVMHHQFNIQQLYVLPTLY